MSADQTRTLHQTILGDIERQIVSGDWPPGYRLPVETDLAAHYQCSRMTVNKVMTQLAKSGLVVRHKKAGSFVSQPRSQSAVLEIHSIEAEVHALGLDYGYDLKQRKVRTASPSDVAIMGIAASDQVLELAALHTASGKPFCYEQRRINASAVETALLEDFTVTPPGKWLLEQVPWSAAEHKIRAGNAPEDVAEELTQTRSAVCLVIERRTWAGERPVTWVRLTYPGDRHSLIARFTPSGG